MVIGVSIAMTGQLFTHYFLTDGIKQTKEWENSLIEPQSFTTFKEKVSNLYFKFREANTPNESVTEQELIRPVLELLGWTDYLPQQSTARNEDIPDHLLFPDTKSKKQAVKEKSEKRYIHALAVQESKRFGFPLDKRDRNSTPHGQIQRYLTAADIVSEGLIRFGILTNGEVWRLYDHRARPRAGGYFEADFKTLLEDEDGLRTFFLIFHRNAFILLKGATTTFIESALLEGRRYEERVSKDLSSMVFERVFPKLVNNLFQESRQSLKDNRDAALVFLYRLLFILYAEDRELLPVNDRAYDDYGMRKRVRDDIANRMNSNDTFSDRATNYYDHLMNLFRIIDSGDVSIGLPPYNGGLFAHKTDKILENVHLSDAVIAPIIYDLSHTATNSNDDCVRRFVNYRDMSVQQLGSIYERLLEHEPVLNRDGKISIRPNPYARRNSGSFYTHQELVDLIVNKTLKPLGEEQVKVFEDMSEKLKRDRRPKAQRLKELRKFDPASIVLNFKVLDPSMGSGHFLVTAVDFLSDYIAELIDYASVVPEYLDGEYVSPLVERIEKIRQEIINKAKQYQWIVDEKKLTDEAIIRRMALKRCIYGVDKNPLTVELAKVSLWLHSFTVGAPLSFLDHHLRCGDSLLGLRVKNGTDELSRLGGGSMFIGSAIAGAEAATEAMQSIEEMSDADVSEVRESATLFKEVEETTSNLRGFLDFLHGLRYLTAGMNSKKRKSFEFPCMETIEANTEKSFELLARGRNSSKVKNKEYKKFAQIWKDATSVANREKFLHWETAFPGVWKKWQNSCPEGGFDAIIGNPPWDRIKLQEVEWFADRAPEIARQQTAKARQDAIDKLRKKKDPIIAEFDSAKEYAEKLGLFFRESGHYPLLSKGDINLYSLFVERAMSLVKPDGLIGLLTPSGIYGDMTAADFFKSVSTTGRISGLFDFENRRTEVSLPPFFPDVHMSFKFCALIFGGEKRKFNKTDCAFFLNKIQTIKNPDRCFTLTPDDFTCVNPNTGTSPVFRTRKDAKITLDIYKQHPILVDRSNGKKHKVYPVTYTRMFDMTNASRLFRTATQLKSKGFYRVEGAGNSWKKRKDLCLPLYEGKMVQAFDHRAASIVVNPDNLKRPAQPKESTSKEHAEPNWLPNPQFWVEVDSTIWTEDLGWALAFKHITSPTNARTMIACIVPRAGFGNSLPILLPVKQSEDEINTYKKNSFLLAANLNAFIFDFITRQKVQGQNLNLFVVEQLPVIAPNGYDRNFDKTTARDLIRDHVLRLTYTANDMIPFARDLGYSGTPFIWEEENRRHLRARLDALYFHLYDISKKDAKYILGTFPIVREKDENEFGCYRTCDLILSYMDALKAGDTESIVL